MGGCYNDPRHDLESDEEEEKTNPFHNGESDSSSERALSYRGKKWCASYEDTGVKVDIPDFDWQLHPEDFIDWLAIIEHVFNLKDILKSKKVKLVAIKLKKHASIW